MIGISKGRSFALGLLLGGLIGTALALLLAPERGEEMRRHVRSRAEPMAERAKDTVTRLAKRGEWTPEDGGGAAADVESEEQAGERGAGEMVETVEEESSP
ncbi:MAG TPA: YtxH domain-containing protein [Dehalococcoidia bacterium]|nr:YtxH domain-containing protein [Dehalococcoidia bacterium]